MATKFDAGSYVWLADDADVYLPAKVAGKFEAGKAGVVSTVATKNNKASQRKLNGGETAKLIPMDESCLNPMDDMVEMKQLDKPSILHNLRMRFDKDQIYTNIGSILVAMNPFKTLPLYGPEVVDSFLEKGSQGMPPHIYAVAENAFNAMITNKKHQSCIVSGESGAGKTETTKLFLQYIAEKSSQRAAQYGANSDGSMQERILQANPLLEAFGNAKTVRNDNSSRFGKWIQIKLSNTRGLIAGASISNYLLEKSRVVQQAEGERNYHVFYQLCAAATQDQDLKSKLKITDADSYFYLNQSKNASTVIDGIDDAYEWSNTVSAMNTMGMNDDIVDDICYVISSVITLGNINFSEKDGKSAVSNKETLAAAAELLGTNAEELEHAMVKRNLSNAREKIFKDHTKAQAEFSRDSFAKAIYSLLFDWLIGKINGTLAKSGVKLKKGEAQYIGVLDIFGFESFEHNSFEQLCINYCNEKLQGHFNDHIFKLEQEMYKKEGIDVSLIEFTDNSAVINVIERKVSGIIAVIDDEMNLPKGSDDGIIKKLFSQTLAPKSGAGDAAVLRKPDLKKLRNNKNARMCFNVVHYAGEVSYDASGFLEKAKFVLQEDLQTIGQKSSRKFLVGLFKQMSSALPKRGSTNPNKKSLGTQFKEQLTILMSTLNNTEPHFVRCIKPNSEKAGGILTASMVMDQLNYAGLLEVCRIRQLGFPIRKDFKQFYQQYKVLAKKTKGHKDLAEALTKSKIVDAKNFQVGKSQVFMRMNQYNVLEEARDKSLAVVVVVMQKAARGMVARKKFKSYKSVLSGITKAAKSGDIEKLEAALLLTGNLPRNGRHLPGVINGRKTLDKLKAEKSATESLETAIKSHDLNTLNAAIKTAKELKMKGGVLKKAEELVKTIKKENDIKSALREAVAANDLAKLTAALDKANSAKISDSNEAKEAATAKQRIEDTNKTVKELEGAIGKKDTKAITKLLETMVGLGAKEHPLVLKGQEITKAEAKASAETAKAMKDTEEKLAAAIKEQDLDALVALDIDVQKLGLDTPVVKEARALRDKLENKKDIVSVLALATRTITAKAKTYDGIALSDVKALAQAINKAKKIVGEKDEEYMDAKNLEKKMKKQVKVQEQLNKALASKVEKDLRAALTAAQELGLEVGAALAVAAEVRELDAEKQEANAANDAKSREANLNRLQEATAEQEANQTMDRLRKLASSKHDKLILEASDNSRYDMGLYYKIRTDEDFTQFEAAEVKAQRASHKLWSVTRPIPMSLLELDAERSRIAVKINKAILQYCGDKSFMFSDAQAQYVLMRGLEDSGMTNEIYLQICKHLRGNNRYESANKAWLLLCMCAKTFPPSEDFAPYLINYLINRKESPGLFGNYARFAIVQLDATLTVGATVFKPQIEEIECYKKRPPILATIQMLDGKTRDFPVTPDLRVNTVLNMVMDVAKVPDEEGPVWGIFIKDSARKEEQDARVRLIRFYQKYNPSKLVNVDSILEIWQDNLATLFQKLVAKYGPEPAEGEEEPAAEDAASKKKKKKGGVALPVTAAKYAAKMLGIQNTYGAPPPPPESPWPLPWWVYLGDVYNRMLRQDREPIFIFKRQIFTDKTPDDVFLYQQLEQEIHMGDLVVKDPNDIATLAAISVALRNKCKMPKADKVTALLPDLLPETKIDNFPLAEWTKMVLSAGASGTEKALQAKYIEICKKSPVYGMIFFYAIRQDALAKGVTTSADQYAVGVDRFGVHILGPDRDFVIRTIPLSAVKKFGATSEYFWMNVDDNDGKKKDGFSLMSSKHGINVLLYTIQSWEMYAVLYTLMH